MTEKQEQELADKQYRALEEDFKTVIKILTDRKQHMNTKGRTLSRQLIEVLEADISGSFGIGKNEI